MSWEGYVNERLSIDVFDPCLICEEILAKLNSMRKPSQIKPTPERARRQRGVQRIETLLGAAASVFSAKGYDAATMTEIAAAAESSIGSLYQFFPTKERLAEALMQAQATALEARLAVLEADSPSSTLEALADRLCGTLIEFRAAHPSFAGLIEAPGAPTELAQEIRQQMRQQLAAILAPHAGAMRKPRLLAVAAVVQQVMKSATVLNAEPAPLRIAALAELRLMLRSYLRSALG